VVDLYATPKKCKKMEWGGKSLVDHGCMNGWMYEWMHGCMDAWMDGWMDG
jgi:hypothetical protein